MSAARPPARSFLRGVGSVLEILPPPLPVPAEHPYARLLARWAATVSMFRARLGVEPDAGTAADDATRSGPLT